MPTLFELVKEFAERARAELLEQIKNQQNELTRPVRFIGYDADGNAIVNDRGEVKTVVDHGNVARVKGEIFIYDEAATVEYKVRKKPQEQKIISPTKTKPKPARKKILSRSVMEDGEVAEFQFKRFREDVVCIAVIDENNNRTMEASWLAWRAAFPERPYYLLEPYNPQYGGLYVPAAFSSDPLAFHTTVVRDNGQGSPDDWFNICKLNAEDEGANVILFIDESGSMTINDVRSSYNLFKGKCIVDSLTVKAVSNSSEDYIAPFYVDDDFFIDAVSEWPY